MMVPLWPRISAMTALPGLNGRGCKATTARHGAEIRCLKQSTTDCRLVPVFATPDRRTTPVTGWNRSAAPTASHQTTISGRFLASSTAMLWYYCADVAQRRPRPRSAEIASRHTNLDAAGLRPRRKHPDLIGRAAASKAAGRSDPHSSLRPTFERPLEDLDEGDEKTTAQQTRPPPVIFLWRQIGRTTLSNRT